MVSGPEHFRDIVLVMPGRSLVAQVADWVGGNRPYAMSLYASRATAGFDRALSTATWTIIDVGEQPERTTEVLAAALRTTGAKRIALYTERPQGPLVAWAAQRAVPVLHGPLDPDEWNGFFGESRNGESQADF